MPDRAPSARKRAYLLLALAVFVLDQWTKWWVEIHLALHRPLEVIPGFLNLTHVENPGVAFGLFAGLDSSLRTVVLTGLGLGALAVVGLYYARIDPNQRLLLASLSLILGGAVGNLTDRILSGSVTDFVDAYFGSYHWHTFNVADSAITIAVGLILWDSFRPGPEGRETTAGSETATAGKDPVAG